MCYVLCVKSIFNGRVAAKLSVKLAHGMEIALLLINERKICNNGGKTQKIALIIKKISINFAYVNYFLYLCMLIF